MTKSVATALVEGLTLLAADATLAADDVPLHRT
jgi:hypothetical protein